MAKVGGKLTAEQVAEKAKPNWKVVAPLAADARRQRAADDSAPELDQLRRKYCGAAAGAEVKPVSRIKKQQKKTAKTNELKMVLMEPKTPSDTRVGRKAVLVDKGKIVGEQG